MVKGLMPASTRAERRRIEFGLTVLEIFTSGEGTIALRKLDDTENKRVLGRAVDERFAFEDYSHGEEG